MNALRQIIDSEGGQLTLNLPKEFHHSTLEIIILPYIATEKPNKKIKFGSWEGKYSIPDDFNAPLEDLKDYM